jgi:hypothetical protein
VLVVAPVARTARPPARDREDAVDDRDVDLGRVDAGELDDDVDRGGIVRPVGVDARAEAAPLRRQPVLAEVREELLHLGLEPVGVPACSHETIVAVGRTLTVAGGVAAFLAYVWVAAVRLAPGIRARKAARRATRKA